MAKILVTGACGYIGSHTLVDLVENGYDVISIDNFSNSFPSAIENIEKITGKTLINYNVDICDLENLRKVFQENNDIVGIIHFAAFKAVNESVQFPLKYYRNNILGLLNILECCKKYKVDNFVFSSSCSVYGNAKKLPVNELTPLAKTESPYAETKIMAERIIQDFSNNSSFKSTLLRYFNPIGAHPSGLIGENPKQEPQNIMPRLTGTAKGIYTEFKVYGNDYDTKDGSCIRDYIHVSDIAHAHTLAIDWLLKKNDSLCEILNIGSGNGISVLELINAFEKGSGKKLSYTVSNRRAGDVVAIYANNDKARKTIKWSPKYSLLDMMKTAWNWDLNK